MEKIECKACSASVDKSIEFCSSCGEWLGLSIKDIDNTGNNTPTEITRRTRLQKSSYPNLCQTMVQLPYQPEKKSLVLELFFF